MATVSTIGTASRNYSTIPAWRDAFTTGGWEGECYADSEFTATATLTFSGHSTSAADYIKLSCAAGQSFADNANAQTNALRYNTANGVAYRCTVTYAATVAVSEDYVTIDGIQFNGTGAGNGGLTTGPSIPNVVFSRLIIENTAAGQAMAPRCGLVKNCLIVLNYTGTYNTFAILAAFTTTTVIAANCTVVRPSDLASGASAVAFRAGNGGTFKVVNCAGFGLTVFSNTGPSGVFSSCSNNASDVAISIGSSNQASKTYANQFVNTVNSTRDFRLKVGADCVDTGTTDTTDIPAADDIVRTSRPQGSAWDIGCWELVQSTPWNLAMDWARASTNVVMVGY